CVIEHGVKPLAEAMYAGRLERGIVVVNNIDRRGRRLGFDVYRDVAREVPLDLVGMGSERVGGLGEVANRELPGRLAQYRFFFNPIRYTSLGLAVIEAMMVGLPIVALATTEMATVVRNGVNGFADTRVERLVAAMRQLLLEPGLAAELGRQARQDALERFGIGRFVRDWEAVLARVSARARPAAGARLTALSGRLQRTTAGRGCHGTSPRGSSRSSGRARCRARHAAASRAARSPGRCPDSAASDRRPAAGAAP